MSLGVKTVCKVRGIILNNKASKFVDFDTIKVFFLNESSNTTVTFYTDEKIKRKKGDGASVS